MTRVNEDVASLPRPIGPTQPNEQGETTQGDHAEVEGTLPCKKRKLAIHDARNDLDNEDGNNYFVLINMSILMNLISSLGKCPECGSTVEVIDLLKLRMGEMCFLLLGTKYISVRTVFTNHWSWQKFF